MNIALTLPRIVKAQLHRPNHETTTPEQYFRVSLFIPLLDNIHADLVFRFPKETLNVFNLNVILPSVMSKNNPENEKQQIRMIMEEHGTILGSVAGNLPGEFLV